MGKSQLVHEMPWLAAWQGIDDLAEIWWPIQKIDEFNRVNAFLRFLRDRPEGRIVVVSHGAFLAHFLGYNMQNCAYHTVKTERLPTAIGPKPPGLAIPPGEQCSVCLKILFESDINGVVCRHRREDLTIGGCSLGVCWTCMKNPDAPPSLGKLRIAEETWRALGTRAWWLHERCMS